MKKYRRILAATLLTASTFLATQAVAQTKDVTFSLSDQMRVTYFWLYLPEILGYWEEEGLKVNVESVGGSLEALQQVVAGNAEFGQMGAVNVIQASAQQQLPIEVVMLNGVFQWKLAVPADGDIKSVQDLKGKSIGVFSASTNGNLYLKAYLAREGIDPDKDVTLLPVGAGPSAIQALRGGEVAALYFWPSAFVSYEDQGMEFTYYQSPEWSNYPDYSVAAMKSTIDRDPEMVEGMARAMIKSIHFVEANPECAVKLFWNAHPDAKPTGVSDEQAMDSSLRMLKAQLGEALHAREAMGDAGFGGVTAESMASLQDFLLESQLIEKPSTQASFIVEIPDFFRKVSDFDAAAIAEQAKRCEM